MEGQPQQQQPSLSREAITAFCTEMGDLRLSLLNTQVMLEKAGQMIQQRDATIAELKAKYEPAEAKAEDTPTPIAEGGGRRRGG